MPLRQIINEEKDCRAILYALHEDCRHQEYKETYHYVTDRYWWKDLSQEVT